MKSTAPRKYIILRFCAVFLALLISFAALTAASAYADEEENSQPSEIETQEETDPVKSGLTEEEGKLYYYLEDGELFKDGYKEVVVDGETKYYYFTEDGSAFTGGYKQFNKDGKRVYYYFQDDGTAYTSGYLNFELGGTQYYYYFTEDGSAFTDGYKEITIDGERYYYYFLPNGQGYHSGYKTAMIDGVKHYFYFGSDGRAETDSLKEIPLGTRTAYYLFQDNGRAYTGGYKEITDNEKTDYYYFLPNGQAYTTGYKTAKIDGETYYFFFENDGKAFTGGLKTVLLGTVSYKYFFQSDGRAYTAGWKDISGKQYYFKANGMMVCGTVYKIGDYYYEFDSDGAYIRMCYKKIFLSPSDQTDNIYSNGKTNEQEQCRRIANALEKDLNRCGFAVNNCQQGGFHDRAEASNRWCADLHVPLHTNAYNKKVAGTRIFVDKMSGEDYKCAQKIFNYLAPITPGKSESISENPTLYEINSTNAMTVYIESEFHDSQGDWIISHVDDIAAAICKGICDYYGVQYIA